MKRTFLIIAILVVLSSFAAFAFAQAQTITMNDGDVVELVCDDLSLNQAGGRLIATCNDAVIETSTPIPPTNTAPPPTETAVSPTPASLTGCVGIIGDSASYARQYYSIWGVSWVEFAAWERDVDFGPYLDTAGCNKSYPGNKVRNIDGQAANLSSRIANGEVGIVIIFIGANDLYPMCSNHYDAGNYAALKNEMITELEGGVADLIGYGMAASDIYMVTQADRTQEMYCSNAAQFGQMVGELNSTITTWDTVHGIHIIDVQDAYDELSNYGSVAGDIEIDGHLMTHQACNEPNCKFTADGHHNTALELIIFNALFADVLQSTPAGDGEIAAFAGLE